MLLSKPFHGDRACLCELAACCLEPFAGFHLGFVNVNSGHLGSILVVGISEQESPQSSHLASFCGFLCHLLF